MTKATSFVYSSSVCVSRFQRSGCLVMKGRTTSMYSFWILVKSVSTASGIPVPLNSLSLSSLDLNRSTVNYCEKKKSQRWTLQQWSQGKKDSDLKQFLTRTWDGPVPWSQSTKRGRVSSGTVTTYTHTAEPAAGGPSRTGSPEMTSLVKEKGRNRQSCIFRQVWFMQFQ